MRRVLWIVAGLYVLLRVGAVVDAPPMGRARFPDTFDYLAVAHRPLFSAAFLAGIKPPAVPLLYKLLPGDHGRVIGQLALSMAAWLALAWSVARSIRHPRLALAAFVLVLAFSCAAPISQWDPVLLSESLTLTLTAALLAAALALARSPTPRTTAVLLVVALLWVAARDTNAYVLLFAALVPLVWLIRARRGLVPVALTIGFAAIAIGSFASADHGGRWKVALVDVIGKRVVGHPAAESYFRDRGMPLRPDLRSELDVPGFVDVPTVLRDHPELDAWLDDSGQSTYRSYLVSHPGSAIGTTWDARPFLFGDEAADRPTILPLSFYRPAGYSEVLPGPASALVYPASWGVLWLYLLALAPPVWWLWRRRVRSRELVVAATALVLTVPHTFVVALGDASEITRHALVLGVLLRLGILLLGLLALDAWLAGYRRSSTSRAARSPERTAPSM